MTISGEVSEGRSVAFQIAGLLAGPGLLLRHGVDGLLLALLALNLLSLAFVPALPRDGGHARARAASGPLLTRAMLAAQGGCFLFYCCIGVYWTYIELIGRAAGHDTQLVASTLAAGVALGLPGALAAAWWGGRPGRLLPLGLGCALVLAAALLVREAPQRWQLLASVVLFNFAWNFSLPYQ